MSADIFVYLDTVQFSKNGVQNRNQIKTAQGSAWLTLPVRQKLGQSILETKMAAPKPAQKHWKTLVASYAHTSGFERWKKELEGLLNQQTDSLADLAIASTEWMLSKLDARARRIRASEIPNSKGKASELVASICSSLKATSYLTGTGALAYMNPQDFSDIGCEIHVQQWSALEYRQADPSAGFVPNLSTLDLLLNCPDEAAHLIMSAGSWKPFESAP